MVFEIGCERESLSTSFSGIPDITSALTAEAQMRGPPRKSIDCFLDLIRHRHVEKHVFGARKTLLGIVDRRFPTYFETAAFQAA